jgi:hypothetical protein
MFYTYDGSFEGFLSALTVLMRENPGVDSFRYKLWGISRERSQLLLVPHRFVPNIPDIIMSFGEYLSSNFGNSILETIYHAFLSECDGIEESLALYVLLARKLHRDPVDRLYIDCVKKVVGASRTCTRESHRFLGLLRFRKVMNKNAGNFNGILAQSGQSQSNHNNREDLSEDRIVLSDNQTAREILLTVPTPEISEIYIASFHPETNVLPLVAEHFTKRLLNQTFIIIDRKRNTCAVHVAGQDFELMVCNPETIKNICYESSYEELWQEYFKNMAIAERINKNLQRSNMPLKYRKYLIEKT